MKVSFIEEADWKANFSESAHLAGFKRYKDPMLEKIDFALLIHENDEVVAYATFKELDKENLYCQFCAGLGEHRGHLNSWRAFMSGIGFISERYKRVSALVENDNFPMLKMAWKAGFRICGIRVFRGNILVEHVLEFKEQ